MSFYEAPIALELGAVETTTLAADEGNSVDVRANWDCGEEIE